MFLFLEAFIAEDGEVELKRESGWVSRLHLLSLLDALIVAFKTAFDAFLVPITLTYLSNVSEVVSLKFQEVDDRFDVLRSLSSRHQMLCYQVEQVFADLDALILQASQIFTDMLMVGAELGGTICLLSCAPSNPTQPHSILVSDLEQVSLLA